MKVFSRALLEGRLVDLHVRDSIITAMVPSGTNEPGSADVLVDLNGMEIYPLMIDVHTHLREPGHGYKEGLESGLEAALLNGISRVAMMANTSPALDDPNIIRSLENRANAMGLAEANINGAATMGLLGRTMAPIDKYPDCVQALSDDGKTIVDERVLRKVFEEAKSRGMAVMSHCENYLSPGHMERTEMTELLKISSVTEEDEACIIKRNIRVAHEVGSRLHICHVSSIEGIESVAEAKKAGLPVTCEVTPHHLFLSTEDIDYSDGYYKVNPPLRTEETRKYLLRALIDGKIDMIASDHAPHAMNEKRCPITEASFGFSGFDSSFLNIYTHLIKPGMITKHQYNMLTAVNPATLLSVPPEKIEVGGTASFMVVKEGNYVLKEKYILSEGKNNPFIGKRFSGRIEMVVKNGRLYKRRYTG